MRKVRVSSTVFSEHNNVTESWEVFNWGFWDNPYDADHQQGGGGAVLMHSKRHSYAPACIL